MISTYRALATKTSIAAVVGILLVGTQQPAESCTTVKLLPRDALHGAEATYFAEALSEWSFRVISKWRGPTANVVEVPAIFEAAADLCSSQDLAQTGRMYVAAADCLPSISTEGVAVFDCEAAAYPVEGYGDYVDFLDASCVATRKDVVGLLNDWNANAVDISELAARTSFLNTNCDVDDWYEGSAHGPTSIAGTALRVLEKLSGNIAACGSRATKYEEMLQRDYLPPLVELLSSQQEDPMEKSTVALFEELEILLEDVYELECYEE